ncbi:MAG: isochorismatase family protein [Malacoplasma sp.]
MKRNIKDLYFNDYKVKIIQRIIFGFFMGFSDVIPGYSGGTTISMFGFLDPFSTKIKNFFLPITIKNKLKIFLWIIPFALSWVVSFLLFSFVSKEMIQANLDWVLIFFFFSFSLFCIPSFSKANKINLSINFHKSKKKDYLKYLYLILGFCFLMGISLGIYFNGGISLKDSISKNEIQFSIIWLWILLSALLAGFCMLIPGISGSFTLFLFGTYDEIYYVVLSNIQNNILLFILIIIFILIGILLSIYVSSILIKRFKEFFNYFCFGIILFVPISLILCYLGNTENLHAFKNIFISSSLDSVYIFVGILISLLISISIFLYLKCNSKKISQFKKNDMLVIVDMQNDFSKSGKIPIKKFNTIANKIDSLINNQEEFSNLKIVISQDLHPNDHFSFEKWGEHCVEHSYGSATTDLINTNKYNCFYVKKGFQKNVENFSIFTEQITKLLLTFIKDNKIDNVYVVGVMSDVCVQETILDLKRIGIKVGCIRNLCSTNNKKFSFDSYLDKTEKYTY